MKNFKIICLILISLLFFSCSMKNKQIELIRKDADQLIKDQTENMQSQAKIKVEGKEIPFRQIAVLISNEKDQNKRRKLFVSQDSFLDSLNVIYKQIEDFYHSQAQELGYNSYNAFAQDLKSIDLENFKPVV